MTTTAALPLTSEQAAAVNVDDGAYLVVAPPGSGKTEVLVHRLVRLLSESPGGTYRILALTFTTRAANNITQRITTDVGDEAWRLSTGTFHHFCLDVLRSYGEPVGVSPDVTVFADLSDRVELLVHGLQDDGYEPASLGLDDASLRQTLAEIDLLRLRLVPPDAAPNRPVAGTRVPLGAAYSAYERVMAHVDGIDFAGMLMRAQRLLAESEWTVRHYRSMYRYILVDEGQDLNLAQYEVLRTLCGDEHRNVFMVADKNQSIFGFNGASTRFVAQFERDFQAERFRLSSNFRCARDIVGVANRLSSHLDAEAGVPPMSAECEARGRVCCWVTDDEVQEASVVAEWTDRLLDKGMDSDCLAPGESAAVAPEQIAVVGRTRYAFDKVADALHRRDRQYALRTGDARLFDSPAWRHAHSTLRLLANPRDFPVRQRLWLEVAEGAVDDPGDPPSSDTELLEVLSEHDHEMKGLIDPLTERASGRLSDAALIQQLVAAPPPDGLDETAAMVWLNDQQQLAQCWKQQVGTGLVDEVDLPQLLTGLSRAQRATVDEPGIRLLTVHAAKGLEFRAVALVGMNQGTFPHHRSLGSPDAIEEERRNAYVAMTRARRVLLLTRPALRQTKTGPRPQDPSVFLGETGVDEKRVEPKAE